MIEKLRTRIVSSEDLRYHRAKPVDWLLLVLVFAFIACFNAAAMHDRLLLILYTIGISGAALIFLKRGAYVLSVVSVAAAGTALLVNVYFAAQADSWHPLLDAVRDMFGVTFLALGMAKLIHEAYRIQKDAREAEMQRQFEDQMVAMRASALRSTSHEVRTPLATITALTETLLDGSAGDLNEIQSEFIRDIDDAAQHLMALVNDILDYAKAEAGMIKLAPEPVALVELVEQCVAMIAPKSEPAGVTVSATVDRELTEVVADPLRLKQILLNLLSNGVKYTGRGGSVNIRVRPDGEEKLLIAVRDTGRGIAPEHLEHLFDPYYQTAVADQSIGTGLGLAIIRHLTDLHGGTVTVESVLGTGTAFLVRLPKVMPATAPIAELPPTREPTEEDVAGSQWPAAAAQSRTRDELAPVDLEN